MPIAKRAAVLAVAAASAVLPREKFSFGAE
jgi:hypothetical protein